MEHLERYRAELVRAVSEQVAAYTDFELKAEYDNRDSVDLVNQKDPFVAVEVVFSDGWQADLSAKPIHRILGNLILTVKCRQGSGSAQAYSVLSHLYTNLQHRIVDGNIRVSMAKFAGKPTLVGGWWNVSVILPFHVNQFPV